MPINATKYKNLFCHTSKNVGSYTWVSTVAWICVFIRIIYTVNTEYNGNINSLFSFPLFVTED